MPGLIASLYKITRELGSGGGGTIYLGRHLRLDKDVVLKADKRLLAESSMKSLKREADTLKNLCHSNIPQIYDFVLEDGVVYTVMDYIEGESLDKALKRGERFTSRQIVQWAKQVSEALVYLHSRPPYGILHSDIKPANIMLTPQGDVRLIDFNIALALGADGAVSVGRSQGYASPEHYGMEYSTDELRKKKPRVLHTAPHQTGAISDLETVMPTSISTGGAKKTIVLDARADIFGLGATLYHLLTGRRPDRNAIEVAPLTARDCPPGLAAIINKAMSPDRNSRFQTASDMLAAFVGIHGNDPRSRRQRWLRSAASVVLAVALALGIFTAFTGLKRMEWEQKIGKLVGDSTDALMVGDRTSAIRLALEALPEPNLFTPSYSPQASQALAGALGVYDLSDGFKLHQTVSNQMITLRSKPLMADLSPDGKTAAIVYAYETAVVDMESGQILFSVPMAHSALAEACFLNDATLVCAGHDGLCAYDIATGARLWCGSPATAVTVAADGKTVAAINRDDSFAMLYGDDGTVRAELSFGGRRQRIPGNEKIINPRYNLFALSASGRFLAISFDDGSVSVFDQNSGTEYTLANASEKPIVFEGGFSGEFLALSATSAQGSNYAIYDMENPKTPGESEPTRRYGILTNESGIFISNGGTVACYNPASAEYVTLAQTGADIMGYAVGDQYTLVALEDACVFFDRDGREIPGYKWKFPADITRMGGDFALLGARDKEELTILRLHEDERLFTFDASYVYDEARLSADGSRFMLFGSDGFQLYNRDGALIRERRFRDEWREDTQYSPKSGNLAVLYKDALTIYSGQDGEEVFEKTGLRSVFYAPYGVSVLDKNGMLWLIDLDSGQAIVKSGVAGGATFAAYCGITVDSAFLDGRALIGAAKTADGYVFAVSDDTSATVYDGNGDRLFPFDFPIGGDEAFFTETAVVISPYDGVPAAYSLENGRKIYDLETDAHLTYVTQLGENTVSQYLSLSTGEHFGVLLDNEFRPIASLPRLCDVWGGQLVFDYPQGVLRCSRVYTIEELMEQAKAHLMDQ